jgi:hypothetical protein
MSCDTEELIRICEQLRERAEVADFARFLLAQQDDAAQRNASAPLPRSAAAGTPLVNPRPAAGRTQPRMNDREVLWVPTSNARIGASGSAT